MKSTTPYCSYRWEKVTGCANFAARDGAGALVFDGRMWLLGGWNPTDKTHFPLVCNSEVWSSVDGVHWELENPQAPWEPRHCSGYVVHDDRMWIVGGDSNQGHHQQDVWCSSDGIAWEMVTDRVPWAPRAAHHTVAFQGKIWVMGGQTIPKHVHGCPEFFYNDVWNSSDGVHWERVLENAPWTPRGMIGGNVVFGERIWLLGGGTYETPRHPERRFFNEVWSSADGIEWKRQEPAAPWAPRQYHEVAVYDGRMWVLEGFFQDTTPGRNGYEPDSGNRNDVWHSADGQTWHELPDTPWAPRHAASVMVYKDALWMITGNNLQPDVWRLIRI